jgi:RimJ/RimL family protein N-acetyltransferase
MTDLLRADLAAVYPQFGVTIAHAGLVLAPPTDVELFELAPTLAEPGGIVAPGDEAFVTWPTGTTDPDLAVDTFLRHHWGLRTRPGPTRWHVPFTVLTEGRAVGMGAVVSVAWSTERSVDTRSWIARADQGRGLGQRVRLMMLELAFVHLGAARATSTAAAANVASQRVSQRCGYRETARGPGHDGTVEVHYAVTPAAWRRRRLADVEVDGLEPFRAAIDP